MTVLSLRFCVRAFSSCGKRGPLFIAVRGPPTITASLVAEHRLQTRRLSNCGSRAQLLRRMWDLPRPGLEPVSPALAGRLSTTAPPGKPCLGNLISSKRLVRYSTGFPGLPCSWGTDQMYPHVALNQKTATFGVCTRRNTCVCVWCVCVCVHVFVLDKSNSGGGSSSQNPMSVL